MYFSLFVIKEMITIKTVNTVPCVASASAGTVPELQDIVIWLVAIDVSTTNVNLRKPKLTLVNILPIQKPTISIYCKH